MSRRSYHQACSLARALDAVGERWSLLIVRDLLLGPATFGELQAGLPGIGTNLLAERLKSMGKLGLVERIPEDDGRGWRLTGQGRALEPALMELIRWAMRTRLPVRGDEASRPEWAFVAMKALFDGSLADGLEARLTLVLNGLSAGMEVSEGKLRVRRIAHEDSIARIEMDSLTGWQLATGGLEHDDARKQGRLTVTGDAVTAEAFLRCFRLR